MNDSLIYAFIAKQIQNVIKTHMFLIELNYIYPVVHSHMNVNVAYMNRLRSAIELYSTFLCKTYTST